MSAINGASILLLRDIYQHDDAAFRRIQECLMSFISYHTAIYRMETYLSLHNNSNTDIEAYQHERASLDDTRTPVA